MNVSRNFKAIACALIFAGSFGAGYAAETVPSFKFMAESGDLVIVNAVAARFAAGDAGYNFVGVEHKFTPKLVAGRLLSAFGRAIADGEMKSRGDALCKGLASGEGEMDIAAQHKALNDLLQTGDGPDKDLKPESKGALLEVRDSAIKIQSLFRDFRVRKVADKIALLKRNRNIAFGATGACAVISMIAIYEAYKAGIIDEVRVDGLVKVVKKYPKRDAVIALSIKAFNE